MNQLAGKWNYNLLFDNIFNKYYLLLKMMEIILTLII